MIDDPRAGAAGATPEQPYPLAPGEAIPPGVRYVMPLPAREDELHTLRLNLEIERRGRAEAEARLVAGLAAIDDEIAKCAAGLAADGAPPDPDCVRCGELRRLAAALRGER